MASRASRKISLPFEVKRGRLSFYLFPSLPYTLRMLLFLLFSFVGVVAVFRVSIFVGEPIVIFALALIVARGMDNSVGGGGIFKTSWKRQKTRWVVGTAKDLRKIQRKMDQGKALPFNPFNARSVSGAFTMIVLIAVLAAFDFFVLPGTTLYSYAWEIVVTQGVIVLFVFFSTTATAWSPPLINTKMKLFTRERDAILKDWKELGPTVSPMLLVRGGKKDLRRQTPEDLKLYVTFAGAPEDFIGVQVQITFNMQQAYLYCVIITKKGFKPLTDFSTSKNNRDEITYKKGADSDVDYLVIRQTTTKTTGYATSDVQADGIVNLTMAITKNLLGG